MSDLSRTCHASLHHGFWGFHGSCDYFSQQFLKCLDRFHSLMGYLAFLQVTNSLRRFFGNWCLIVGGRCWSVKFPEIRIKGVGHFM
ncbi:hypothetical protein GDO78_012819 [Eleutherodactylus coqui]|uniref:Uncharacterized protein n=1 Tax=Eleutherodactylus coqui TaxID=57060 RepID=A0A8J6F2E8_ELECQ|nr:hypothetical protein GDO78_012819 [Eleutherodactylus coqui]